MTNNSSCWYCPKCKEELDGCHVTYQELCEYCGTAVLSVPESISQETIKEIIKAKADGRLVVLPCKVGDTIWKIKSVFSYFSKPMEDRVDRIIISNNEILVCCTGGAKFSIDSIGKTVFLTREEAEKALEGSK
jgi:hypothetical protein